MSGFDWLIGEIYLIPDYANLLRNSGEASVW